MPLALSNRTIQENPNSVYLLLSEVRGLYRDLQTPGQLMLMKIQPLVPSFRLNSRLLELFL